MNRRIALGEWDPQDILVTAQVIFFPDGRTPLVCLNAAVSAEVKVKKGLPLDDPGFHPSRDEVEYIRINEESLKDCGHVTMILFRDGYQLSFDFIYNQKTCGELIKIADEYLQLSTLALNNQLFIGAMDTAYTAFETLAKISLLLEANRKLKTAKRHDTVVGEFQSRFRNATDPVIERRRKMLQELFDVRAKVRHGRSDKVMTKTEIETIMSELQSMRAELNHKIKNDHTRNMDGI